MPRRILIPAALLALLAAACGGTATTDAASESASTRGEFAFGRPALPTGEIRTVEIVSLDSMRFRPDAVTVAAGEVVTFRVVNEGKILHNFVLGDRALQESHAAEPAHEHPWAANTLNLPAGESGSLTWRFEGDADVLFACHVPGHYAAGMVGTITIR